MTSVLEHPLPPTIGDQWPGVPASVRLGSRAWNRFLSLFGPPARRRLARAALHIDRIRFHEGEFDRLADPQVTQFGKHLRGRARGGEPLDKLLPEAFALACVACKRAVGLRPYDVQLAAGAVLHGGAVAELATGEGKTLTAVLPAYLNALTGKGVHVTTVNDYLAKRDAEWMTPAYEMLGISVGYLQQRMPDAERAQMYRKDITHGTASDFGFDFLRDKLKLRATDGKAPAAVFWNAWLAKGDEAGPAMDPRVQRGHHFALVDEADSVFIDEARTPLIIGNPTRPATKDEQLVYRWADAVAQQMVRNEHFLYDEKKSKIDLTDAGRRLVRWSNPPVGEHSHAMDKLIEHIERALYAHHRYRRDQHYMVLDDKVVLVDESTGRAQPDRHWREGMHQAVEVKEGVTVTKASPHAAEITYQSYFRMYKKLAGMTGTAAQNWLELRRVYKLWVVCVPTNRPVIRQQWPDTVFPTENVKFAAVVEEIKKLNASGRPVLVGTRSVDKSEDLSKRLTDAGIKHQVLNARNHAAEAEIVKQAGMLGRVTVATNMAGRGTDIKPEERVLELGGLHVLGTERHESLRIDRQLAGRAGRQGDPGSCQFFVSLEDDLLEGLGPDRFERIKAFARKVASEARNWQQFLPWFVKAQRRMERRHRRQRIDLMLYHRQREEILKELGADLHVD